MRILVTALVLGMVIVAGCGGGPSVGDDNIDIIGKYFEGGRYKVVTYYQPKALNAGAVEVWCVSAEEYARLSIGMDNVTVIGRTGEDCQ